MAVISATHLNLVRARREMQNAFKHQDWEAVKDWDQLLSVQLGHAFDDPQKDHSLLVSELQKVLALYGQMVHALPDAAIAHWRQPESV